MQRDLYIGKKIDDTGAFGFEIYCDNNQVCYISSLVIPSFPVTIKGFGYNLVSEFDIDSTLIPGLTRFVVHEDSCDVAFKIVYIDQGVFDINIEGKSIVVMIDENKYTFFSEGIILATGNIDNDSGFNMIIGSDLHQKIKLAIISFPMLRFAI